MMKMIAPLLALSLITSIGCGGKKAAGNDCTAGVENAAALSKPEIAKLGVNDADQAKMKDMTLKHCSDDKWDAKVVACLSGAKTYEDTLKCTDGLGADQKTKWTNDMSSVLPKPKDPPPTDGSAGSATPPAAGSGSGSGSGSGKGAMNDDCKELGRVVDSLASCTKLPKSAQDAYKQVIASNAGDCKATAAAIHESTATICP